MKIKNLAILVVFTLSFVLIVGCNGGKKSGGDTEDVLVKEPEVSSGFDVKIKGTVSCEACKTTDPLAVEVFDRNHNENALANPLPHDFGNGEFIVSVRTYAGAELEVTAYVMVSDGLMAGPASTMIKVPSGDEHPSSLAVEIKLPR